MQCLFQSPLFMDVQDVCSESLADVDDFFLERDEAMANSIRQKCRGHTTDVLHQT